MLTALSATPMLMDTISLPLLIALAIAAVVLVAIAARMRRLRTAGGLTLANTSVGGASAALVVAATILASMSLGVTTPASAHGPAQTGPASGSVGQSYQPIAINELEGFQLPTE